MPFYPRTTEPSASDPWWIHVDNGGRNSCLRINASTGSVLPNCVGYVWGRWGEILGGAPRLSRGDAGAWFGYTADGYQRGQAPQLGAVLCTTSHVAVVEEMSEGGAIIRTSESEYGGRRWVYQTRRKAANYVFKGTFLGFIYLPGTGGIAADDNWSAGGSDTHNVGDGWTEIRRWIDRKKTMMDAAHDQLGKDNSWTCDKTGIRKNQAWSAAFIVACAKAAGVLNVIIPDSYSCSGMLRAGIMREMGTWIPRDEISSAVAGDLVFFRRSMYDPKKVNYYYADGVGLVVQDAAKNLSREYHSASTEVICGDVGGVVTSATFSISDRTIYGIFRPKWDEVNAEEIVPYNIHIPGGLYTSAVSINDPAVKEIGYMSGYQPSISTSSVRLSVINYTGLLSGLYSVFGAALTAADSANTSDQEKTPYHEMIINHLSTVSGQPGEGTASGSSGSSSSNIAAIHVDITLAVRQCYNYFLAKQLNTAAVCGILANIKGESGFNTAAVGDGGTSFGLCQWHLGRGASMKEYCGDDWATDIYMQLNYLWKELNGGYNGVLAVLRSVPNTEAGAATAADCFVRRFEVPANVDQVSNVRQGYAKGFFQQFVGVK